MGTYYDTMAYDIGTTISFVKEERKSASQFLVDVGSKFKFVATESGYRAARIIPVMAMA